MVEYPMPESHIDDVSWAVKIWGGADQDATWLQRLCEASQREVTGNRQVLDNLRKEYVVKFSLKWRIGFTEIPLECFHALARQIVKMGSGKIRRNSVVVPELCS